MKRVIAGVAVAALLVLPVVAGAQPILKFDDPTNPGGIVSYNGAGGAAVGTDILFQSIQGLDTPLNNNVTLACVGCVMNFTTGLNTQEGTVGATPWLFGPGGTIQITGSIPTLGIPAGSQILTGTFTGTPAEGITVVEGEVFGLFIGSGSDAKNPALAAFFGLANPFTHGTTSIQADVVVGANGSFSGTVFNADLNNLGTTPVQVPAPVSLMLIGLGLVGVVATRRLLAR
jgi:hypothetical protein